MLAAINGFECLDTISYCDDCISFELQRGAH
jgi:hypothetical protein